MIVKRGAVWVASSPARRPELLWVGLTVAAGCAIALTPVTFAAALLVGLLVVLVTSLRPQHGLYLLALAVPFGSLREVRVGPMALGGAEAVAVMVVASWLARSMALGIPIRLRSPMTLPLVGFLGAELLSLTGALSLQHSAKELLRWLELLAVYLAAVNTLDARRARHLIAWLVIGGVLEGLLGAYQFVRQEGPPGFVVLGGFMRAYGTFEQPNPYAGFLGMVAPLAVGAALTGWRGWRGAFSRARCAVAAWGASFAAGAVTVAGIVMSWSRGAWIALIGVLSAIVLGRGWRSAAIGVGGVIAAAALLGPASGLAPGSLIGRLSDVPQYLSIFDARPVEVNPDNFSAVERMAHWQAAWAMFSDRPWLGVGAGNYEVVYPAYRLPAWREALGHAHNYYLNVLAESGLVGLAAYLAVLCAGLALAWHSVRACRGLDRGLALGVFGALVHLAVHNLFDNLYVHGMNLHVAMLLGVAAVLLTAARGERHDAPGPVGVR